MLHSSQINYLQLVLYTGDTQELQILFQCLHHSCCLCGSVRDTQLRLLVAGLARWRTTSMVTHSRHRSVYTSCTSKLQYCSSVRIFLPTTSVLSPSRAILPHCRDKIPLLLTWHNTILYLFHCLLECPQQHKYHVTIPPPPASHCTGQCCS